MVLLLQKLGHSLKLYSKLDNHHNHHFFHHHNHHQTEALSASLEAFRSDVSKTFNQLLSISKSDTESLSLSWIKQCFNLFPVINKAFIKLLVDIEYPFSQWEAASIEEYLSYSLNVLDLLNSFSSSLSQLGQSRISLSHALSLVQTSPFLAIDRLKPIDYGGNFIHGLTGEKKNRSLLGKELVIHQALMILKSVVFWVFGIILSSLYNNDKPYLELQKLGNGLENSALIDFNLSIYEEIIAKKGELKEVIEVNQAVLCLAESLISTNEKENEDELRRKLEILEKMVRDLGEEVNHVFAEVLAGRNELLDCLRKQLKQ